MKDNLHFFNFKAYKIDNYSSIRNCFIDATIEKKKKFLFFSWVESEVVTFTFSVVDRSVYFSSTLDGKYYLKYDSVIQKYLLENNLV